jgi:vancomycin resistance protein YoaR
MKTSRGSQKLIDKKFVGNVLLICATVIALLFFCGFVGVSRILEEESFAPGVLIDGMNVSGMSFEEAEEAVAANILQQLSDVFVTLDYKGESTVLDANALGVSINAKDALDRAYHYNKNEAETIEQRFDKTSELSAGVDFMTEMTVDQATLYASLERYAAQYYQSPTDATAAFDADTTSFFYTLEQPGKQINVDRLCSVVLENLSRQSSPVIQVEDEAVLPNVTRSALEQNTSLISTYETVAENNPNRNINIALICDAVNGLEIKPGETLSINELVGKRTENKGFKSASAISDGLLVDEVGGGICQLAGTLYNAALLADLDIVERVKHTWPSSYLPIGQDSTLNWNNKDLKIRNPFAYSVFISARFVNQKLTVKLYGQPLEDGVTIEVQNNIIEEVKPGATEIRYTRELPVGSTQTVRQARTGYRVEVSRIYYQNGVETHRELVSKDYYPALNKIVLKGRTNSEDK